MLVKRERVVISTVSQLLIVINYYFIIVCLFSYLILILFDDSAIWALGHWAQNKNDSGLAQPFNEWVWPKILRNYSISVGLAQFI